MCQHTNYVCFVVEQTSDLCARKGNPDTCGELESLMLESQSGCFTRWRGTWTD